ncbi:GNAT family N-acetyltransferase [Corallococcus sp. M34]|uniref:GNAT family N-acetyltransferase n=1 Tax=Citreicoccus inhibens TaxID=2849499 RepID=UPI001C2191AF|nr:GNAT family protein [Citreicoccus inhibens]MBU8894384.1 GNAT family N-acetyltransferase [Citreicoccus inhibens]
MPPADIRLVRVLPEHLDFWLALRAEPTSRRFVSSEEDSRESLLKRLMEASGEVTQPQAKSFRWMVEVQGQLAGTVSARELSRTHGRVVIGYMISEAHQGQGVCTRAVGLMLERLFALPFLQRVWLHTLSHNAASQAVARKLGFTHEGTLRAHVVHDGERFDQQHWGLLRSEWRGVPAR